MSTAFLPVLYCQPCCRHNPHKIFSSFSGPNFEKYLAVWFSRILYIPILSGYTQASIRYTLFSTWKSLNWPGLSSHRGGCRSERCEFSARDVVKQPTSIKSQKKRKAIVPMLTLSCSRAFIVKRKSWYFPTSQKSTSFPLCLGQTE